MSTPPSRNRIFFALVGLLCLAALFVRMRSTELLEQSTPGKAVSSYQELKRTWEDVFNRTPEGAYAEFIQTADTLPYSDAHSLAHIIGAILYDREGIAGLSYCTRDVAFGCYHGFAGAVIEKLGITGVGKFADACKDLQSATDCEHGVGHGLLAYLGSEQFIDALNLCPQAPSGSVGGCYNGVFMEYFLSTLQRDEGVPIRALDASAPEEPCRSDVPKKFQPACYYELPAWWRAWAAVGGATYEEQFKVIGTRCVSVADSNLREVCFQGAGAQIAVFSQYDTSRIQEWCSSMPEPGRALCLSEALHSVPDSKNRMQAQQLSL